MPDLGGLFMSPVLANQKYLQNESLLPAELAQKLASTRYTSALADKVEMDNASDKRAAELMLRDMGGGGNSGPSGGGDTTSQPASMSGSLYHMAKIYAAAGNPKAAAEYTAKASQAAAHEATERAAQARQGLQEFQQTTQEAKTVAGLLNNVNSEESWRAINGPGGLFEQEFHKPSPFKDTPYDPQLVDMLKTSTMTAYQREVLKTQQQRLRLTAEDVGSKLQHRAAQEEMAAQKQRDLERERNWKHKQGGKDVGAPPKGEIDAASRLLGPEGLEGDDLDNAAYSVASEARALRKKNAGMSSDDAMRQAILLAKQRGELKPGGPVKFLGITTSQKGPGKFSKDPMPVPGKKSELKEGGLYTFPNGAVGRWTKGGWEKVAVGGAAGGDESDDEDDDGDD